MVFARSPSNLAGGVERHLGMRYMIAAVRVGEERLAAVRNPFHRASDALRRPQRHHFLGIDEDLRAEAAADIGRDDAQLVLGRHADKGRDDQTRHMGILGGVPQRERAGAGVEFADRGARLHGVRHQAVVDDVELGDVLGGFERGVRPPWDRRDAIDRSCSGRDLVNLRRAGLLRRRGIGDRRQHPVVDFHFLRGIARLRQRFGDHDRHRIADMAGLVHGQRRMRRHLHRRAVLGMDHPAANEIADLVGGEVLAGEHADTPGMPAAALVSIDLMSRARAASGRNRRKPGRAG